MSRSNVEIVRAAFDAFARGDLDGVLAMMDPDVLWAPALARVLGAGEVRGTEALRRFFTETLSAGYADFEAKAAALEDHGDFVLVESHYSARGRASGVPVSLKTYSVILMRDEKCVSYRDYDTREEALAAIQP